MLAAALLALSPLAAPTPAAPSLAAAGGLDPRIDAVFPSSASPGDVVVLVGSDLQNTTSVEFSAMVGGFVGFWSVDVAPLAVSTSQVVAIVPTMAGFAPPNATPPGDPLGSVTVDPISQDGVDFYFDQGSNGLLETVGLGSTQQNGVRAAIDFDLAAGPPTSPNPNFVLELVLAQPGSPALVAIGAPAAPPLPFGDGELAISLAAPITFFGPFVAGPGGEASAPLAIPPGFSNVSAVLQWVVVDPITLGVAISNGLQVSF